MSLSLFFQALDFNLPSYKQNDIYNRPDMRQYGMALYTLGFLGVDKVKATKLTRNQHVSAATQAKYASLLDTKNLYEKIDKSTLNIQFDRSINNLGDVDKDLSALIEPLITDSNNFPLMAESVANVPPALVMTMGLDPLCDEGLLYLRRMGLAGVDTEHYHDDICWHGALNFSDGPFRFECGDRIVLRIIKYISQYSNQLFDN